MKLIRHHCISACEAFLANKISPFLTGFLIFCHHFGTTSKNDKKIKIWHVTIINHLHVLCNLLRSIKECSIPNLIICVLPMNYWYGFWLPNFKSINSEQLSLNFSPFHFEIDLVIRDRNKVFHSNLLHFYFTALRWVEFFPMFFLKYSPKS